MTFNQQSNSKCFMLMHAGAAQRVPGDGLASSEGFVAVLDGDIRSLWPAVIHQASVFAELRCIRPPRGGSVSGTNGGPLG